MLISDIVEYAARKHPRRAAVLFEDEEITFAELRDRVRRTANALLAIAEPGDRVAVLSENRPEYLDPSRTGRDSCSASPCATSAATRCRGASKSSPNCPATSRERS